jgi:FKBP-type peptidyl-prolyl cis-trans isomerase
VNRPSSIRPLLCLVLSLCAAVLVPAREKLPIEDLEIVEQRWPNAKITFTGLRYLILEPGDAKGPCPPPGTVVSVAYKGMLLNGKVFDEQTDKSPLRIRIARGNLIDGWEEALQKMHKGEKWLLIVPPELGYGAAGKPPVIKRYSTLVFEMHLIDFGPQVKEN